MKHLTYSGTEGQVPCPTIFYLGLGQWTCPRVPFKCKKPGFLRQPGFLSNEYFHLHIGHSLELQFGQNL